MVIIDDMIKDIKLNATCLWFLVEFLGLLFVCSVSYED